MKKGLILLLALLLLAGCTSAKEKPANESKPTDAPVSEMTKPEPTEEIAPEPEPEPTTEPTPEPEPEPEPKPVAIGELSFDTVTLSGDPIDAGIIRDYDLVVVNCWAEWCGPCVGEMPELERIHQDYPNVLILGVLSFSNDPDAARETVRETGVTYPVLEPAGSLTALVDQFDAIPATMFFDGEGNQIAEPVIGSRDYTEWKTIIDELLGSETEPFPTEVAMEEYQDEYTGSRMISITAVIPAHTTLRIDFPCQDDYTYRNDEDRAILRKVKMPVEVFYPGTPLEEAEQIFTPTVTLETEDGKEIVMGCASFSVTFPELHLELSDLEPGDDGVYHVKANGDGLFTVTGLIDDPTAEIYVNDRAVPVYEGGVFIDDLAVENGQPTTYEIRVEKQNCVSAAVTVVVEP